MHDGVVAPDVAHVLGVLENAAIAVTATRLIPGESSYETLSVAAPAGEADFVAKGGTEEIRDLLWLGPATDAAVHLADFLGLAAPGAEVERRSFDVSRDGWFALCSLADHQMLGHLRARLDGATDPFAPPTVEGLAALASESLERRDTFRATYAAERLAPASQPPDISGGMVSLAKAGLANGDPVELSSEGRLVVESLVQALVWGQVTATLAGESGPPACLTTVRGVTNALVIGWNDDGSACSVNVHDAPSATYVLYRVLGDAVERSAPPEEALSGPLPVAGVAEEAPTAATRFCASCGGQISASAKFCAACGRPVGG